MPKADNYHFLRLKVVPILGIVPVGIDIGQRFPTFTSQSFLQAAFVVPVSIVMPIRKTSSYKYTFHFSVVRLMDY
jgi:hypothetical protein